MKREKIILAPGGTAEREVAVDDIVVPNLWHIAMSFPKDSQEQKMVLETWHLAHSLLKNLKGEV